MPAISTATTSGENLPEPHCMPVRDLSRAEGRSFKTLRIDAAAAAGSPGGYIWASRPPSTVSIRPGISGATSGVPASRASAQIREKLSRLDVTSATSREQKTEDIEGTTPMYRIPPFICNLSSRSMESTTYLEVDDFSPALPKTSHCMFRPLRILTISTNMSRPFVGSWFSTTPMRGGSFQPRGPLG